MKYARKVVDRDTGQASWIDLGDHLPITEAAAKFDLGPIKFREVLSSMDILHREHDDRAQQFRNRLTPFAVKSGFGIRHDNIGFKYDQGNTPFDVLTPLGMEYVADNLHSALAAVNGLSGKAREASEALARYEDGQRYRVDRDTGEVLLSSGLGPLDHKMRVSWLADRYCDLSAPEIAKIVGINERIVRRYLDARAKRLQFLTTLAEKKRQGRGETAQPLLPGSLGTKVGPLEVRDWAAKGGPLPDYHLPEAVAA